VVFKKKSYFCLSCHVTFHDLEAAAPGAPAVGPIVILNVPALVVRPVSKYTEIDFHV